MGSLIQHEKVSICTDYAEKRLDNAKIIFLNVCMIRV